MLLAVKDERTSGWADGRIPFSDADGPLRGLTSIPLESVVDTQEWLKTPGDGGDTRRKSSCSVADLFVVLVHQRVVGVGLDHDGEQEQAQHDRVGAWCRGCSNRTW